MYIYIYIKTYMYVCMYVCNYLSIDLSMQYRCMLCSIYKERELPINNRVFKSTGVDDCQFHVNVIISFGFMITSVTKRVGKEM